MTTEKSLIDIYDSKGNITTMELVFAFSHNNYNFIVYKELNNETMYAAKYKKSISEDFDSNLTKEELELVNKVYKELSNDNK